MSLKNIMRKSIASLGAISLIFGNCSICGIGLSHVIAENSNAPAINIELVNEKYVQYQYNKVMQVEEQEVEEEIKGVAVQSKLSIYPEYSQDTYLPTESVEISFNLPRVNEYLPEKATVVESSTKSTTGKEIDTSVNQNYDSNSGLLTVSYNNTPDENENIYSTYNENAKDEFEIIYIYPAEAYTGNEEEIKIQSSVNAEMIFKTENGSVTTEITQSFELTEKDNKGDISTFGITELNDNIYKGFMYANVQNGTSYDTEFNTVSTFAVLNSGIADEMTMELKDSKFVLNDEEGTEILTNGNVVYKATQISKAEFDRMLGQEGTLEIYNGETLVATVKYIEVSENEEIVKKLAVIYSDEDIRILSDEDTKISVEYKEDISSLKIKISKPIAEGFIHFENKNVIKASEDYGTKVESIKYLSTEGIVNEYSSNVKMELLEPETKIEVISSNSNFSTLQTNKTTLTINLDSTNASTKLFDNPTITVKLPDGLVGGNLSSPEILNGNGLTIKRATASNNTITIELEGKQTEYDLTNVSGGSSIVMAIENIDFKDTIPTHTDKIEVTCKQGEEKKVASCDVNIVSKAGLLVLSNLTGFDNNTALTSIDSEVKTVEIESEAEQKEIAQTIDLVNNFDDKITNTEIVGRIGYTSDELNSTFDLELSKPIEIDSGKIYYSTNKNASYNDESWTEEFTSQAKAYKIEINNNELEVKDTLEIKVYFKAQANIGYNQTTYIKTDVNYMYNEQNLSDSSTFGMLTAKVEEAVAMLADNIDSEEICNYNLEIGTSVALSGEIIDENYEVYEGQILRYYVVLKNKGPEAITDLNIQTLIENAVYYEITVDGVASESPATWYREAGADDLERNNTISINSYETICFEYQVVVNQNVDVVKNHINISKEGTNIYNSDLENNVKEAELKVNVASEYNEEDLVYSDGELDFIISITNITNSKLRNIETECILPDILNYDISELDSYFWNESEKEFDAIEKDEHSNTLHWTINSIEAGETVKLYVRPTVDVLDMNIVKKDVSLVATVNCNNVTYTSNDLIKTIYQNQTGLVASISSNVEEETVLEDGEEIVLNVILKNEGNLNLKNISIELSYLENLKVEKYINKEDNKEIISNYSDSLNIEKIELDSKEQKEFVIYTTVEIIDEIASDVATLNIDVLDDYSNTISFEESYKINIPTPEDSVDEIDEEPENDVDSEEIPTIVEENVGIEDEILDEENEDIPTTEENGNNNAAGDNTNSNEKTNNAEQTYTISGIAWLDSNKDGQRDENEILQGNIAVSLIDMTKGNFALDSNGNKITTTTNAEGKYIFSDIPKGTYAVIFEFDTNTYTVATYQKEGISEELNSDAILSTVTINDEKKLAGLTDKIELTSNIGNIDIGLIENATFNLSLDKKITEITVVDKQGTETYEYEDGHTAKVDLVAKYMNGANVIVNYKFTITNNGDVTGYVDSLVDSLPSGLEFSSELNKDWYKGSDGNLYTTSLSGKAIKPGESIEIELVLTKTMTEENAGTFANNAKLEKISNLENINEKEDAIEDNESSAILIISIKTGSAILYIGITTICLAIIGIGIYLIKKKVLNRGI